MYQIECMVVGKIPRRELHTRDIKHAHDLDVPNGAIKQVATKNKSPIVTLFLVKFLVFHFYHILAPNKHN